MHPSDPSWENVPVGSVATPTIIKGNTMKRDGSYSQFDDDQDPSAAIRSSIERLGCHIPMCIARSLEDNPLDASSPDHQNGSSQVERRSSIPRRLSWSNTSQASGFTQRCGSVGSWSSTLDDEPPISQIVPGHFPMPLPNGNVYYRAALLLVDISGFTRLSTLLDVESLSNEINNYFELLIRQVEMFGGDVLKFAGDAFYAEWREEDDEDDEDLEDAVCMAALCGASIVKKYSGYKVAGLASEVALLDVHCGVGVGKVAALHVGNSETRREFLFLGDPIDQVSTAEAMAENGQLVASPEAIAWLEKTCEVSDDILSSGGPRLIASSEEQLFQPEEPFEEDNQEPQPYRLTYVSPNILEPLRHQMSLYVHPSARTGIDDTTQGDYYSRKVIADAEIRSVYTIFVKAEITSQITGDKSDDSYLFSLLNDIMGVTLRVLHRFKGHLRQFIVDDKGVVLIATFGQRGATFPNLVTEKGLPATIAIHDALKIDLDVDSRVGATFGKAYCGVVGGLRRHEFAVLGPSVNLAARLMSSKNNPGILVDDAVRMMASKRFDFLSHRPVKAKGYTNLVPIFEPKSEIERQWNKIGDFVGRATEIDALVRIGRRQLLQKKCTKTHVVLIQAHSGLGKSSLAIEAMDMIRRTGRKYEKEVTIRKNVCKDGEQRVPFGVFREIVLGFLDEINDDRSISSDVSPIPMAMDDLDDFTANIHRDRLQQLCLDLNYSEEFADLIGENMLGLKSVNRGSDDPTRGEKLTPNDAVDFVVDAFVSCTSHSDFVLLAIDDVHWMDSMSWKVVERLVERGKNLMVICISRPFAASNVPIDSEFLKKLREDAQTECPHFTEIHLSPFTKDDVRALLAAAFQCEARDIHADVCDYLYEQTGGMPYFAKEVVGNMIRNDLLEWRPDGLVGWRSGLSDGAQKILYGSLNDLLLHRLDNFNSDARTLLQVCAVLGFEFSLSELLKVQCRGTGRKKKKQIQKIQDILHNADKERILVEICQGGSSNRRTEMAVGSNANGASTNSECDVAERWYTFSHGIWRNCVLGTMLRERERDLHRNVATILEGDGFDEVVEPRSAMKLFGHWKASGDLMKATRLARKIGKYLDSLLLHRQSIEFCLEALEMWQDWRLGEDEGRDLVAGISPELLENITADDLDCLARFHIAVAKNYANLGDGKNAGVFYQKCDLILTKSPAAANLKDRTIFFTLYSGLFALVQSGVVASTAEEKNILQKDLASKFVEQAKIQGDRVHLARALAMESLTFAGLGRFEDAICIQKQLEEIYSAEELSEDICREYATDRAAQNYGYSVLWYEICGRHEEAQNQIDFILDDLMPKMPPKNVHNSIMILFPSLCVLTEKGMARKAESMFLTHIYDRFYEFYGEGSSTFFFKIYKPLKVLFRISSDLQEGGALDNVEYKEVEDWVLSDEVGLDDKIRTTPMCAMGRDIHCIIAEICWCLAMARDEDARQKQLLEKGLAQAQKSSEYTGGSPAFEYARRLSEQIMQKFLSR